MVRLALRSALSDRNLAGRIVVLDSWKMETPSTKSAISALRAIGIEGKVLVVLTPQDDAVAKSLRNVVDVQIVSVAELNAYDVLCNDWLVFTQASLPMAKEGDK
jgi:large subunit ribosomal protein L4